MKKRMLAALMAAAMLFTVLPAGAGALTVAGKTEDEICYLLSDTQATITGWYSSGALVIPSTVKDRPVTAIERTAFGKDGGMTSVVIPEGVVTIGNNAFNTCTALESVTLPESLTEVDGYAFGDCTSLKSIVLPENLTMIGEGVLSGCTALESVTLPESLTAVVDLMFSGCTGLRRIDLPENVTAIGQYAFAGCTGLTELTLPGNVTTIGEDAFQFCSGLTRLVLPESLTTLGSYALEGCTGLTEITIPAGVTGLGQNVFKSCANLRQITVAEDNPVYSSRDGVLFDKTKTTLICYPDKKAGVYAVPASVSRISAYAFMDSAGLKSIIIPAGVTEIGTYAFRNCTGLTDVYYTGSQAQWESIAVGAMNTELTNAVIHYNCAADSAFADVPAAEYYAAPVAWAVDNGVTNGMTETTFAPGNTCTRGQIVTFLWRYAGSPEPEAENNPFADVSSGDYFYQAVLWAVEQGITNGMTETTFVPDGACTRAQAVTFLWRAQGKTAPGTAENPFTDVQSADYFAQAVLWAAANGVTNGVTETAFDPGSPCTRGQIVTFLYRVARGGLA